MRTIHWWEQLHKLQFDLTSHCNARCGACVRNNDGGAAKPGMELRHIELDLWKRIATEDTKGAYIRHISLNGNWGDSAMHPDLVEMIDIWTAAHPESMIAIATNGSIRNKKFWEDLAAALRKASHHKIDFAMDGMEDTHSIYRRRTSHAKLCENIKTFTDAGGVAFVLMTLFEHNNHQIEEVSALADSLGARHFVARNSFTGDKEIKIIDDQDKAYYSMKAALIPNEVQHHFPHNESPNNNLKDSSLYGHINENFKEIFPFYQKSKCPWQDEGELQIDPWGIVWPCCHTSLWGGGSAELHTYSVDNDIAPGDGNIPGKVLRENDLHDRSLKDIVTGGFFSNKMNKVIADASWGVCRNNCGICKD